MNAILLAVAIIALVILLSHILERFAKPASEESMGRMSMVLMVLVFVSLIGQLIYMAISG